MAREKFDNYRYYFDGDRKIVAVSTYAGKTVRGVAKCDPSDEFDLERGKRLAAARCNAKVAKKRADRAAAKWEKAQNELDAMKKKHDKVHNYFVDAVRELAIASEAEKYLSHKM